MTARARRGPVLALTAALIAGLIAAWLVDGYTRSLENRGGEQTQVLVVSSPLAGGERLDLQTLDAAVEPRMVPASYVSAGAIATVDELAGLRPLADLPVGTQLTATHFAASGSTGGFKLRRGERAVTVGATLAPDGDDPAPGRVVDLFAAGVGGGTSVEAVVFGAEVLAITDDESAGDTESPANGESRTVKRPGTRRLTLRIAQSQAASLIRADAFAEDLRAVLRP